MNYKNSIQAIDYLANNYPHNENGINKMAILKLLFFAERYHLRKYGRMITNDTFYAMKHGPVASGARNILFFDDIDTDNKYTKEILEEKDKYTFVSKFKLKDEDYDYLSETDKEALDFAIEKFGHLKEWDLVEETHKYPEWNRFKSLFNSQSISRESINMDDFFSPYISEDDPYKCIPMELVELSKEFYKTGF